MLARFGKWIAGQATRSPSEVRGAQKLALIDQKINQTQVALRVAERTLAGLLYQEKAGLQQAEAMMLCLIAGHGVDRLAMQRAQTVVADTAGQIGVISRLLTQTKVRLATLKEAAIAGRALRLEHIGHCTAIDQALSCPGPEAADRLMAQLPRDRVPTKYCALLGGAAKLHFQLG